MRGQVRSVTKRIRPLLPIEIVNNKNKMNSKKLFANYREIIYVLVIFSAILVISYKFFLTSKKRSWVKIILFINSLVLNDIALRYVR